MSPGTHGIIRKIGFIGRVVGFLHHRRGESGTRRNWQRVLSDVAPLQHPQRSPFTSFVGIDAKVRGEIYSNRRRKSNPLFSTLPALEVKKDKTIVFKEETLKKKKTV